MLNIEFDVKQFNKMMAVDTGEIQRELINSSKQKVKYFSIMIFVGGLGILSFGLSFVLQGGGVSSLIVALGTTLAYILFMYKSVIKTYKEDVEDSKGNRMWKWKLSNYASKYDIELGITSDEISYNIDELREVYFNDNFEAYIPILNMIRDENDKSKIKFGKVPENYHKIDYFKHYLNREDLIKLKEIKDKIHPTFDEVVVILQSEAEILKDEVKYTENKKINKSLDKNMEVIPQTINVLNNKNKELLKLKEDITNKELPKLYRENKEILETVLK